METVKAFRVGDRAADVVRVMTTARARLPNRRPSHIEPGKSNRKSTEPPDVTAWNPSATKILNDPSLTSSSS